MKLYVASSWRNRIGNAEDEPDHPAAKAGLPVWYQCKHCDAWTEDADA
jgi:hypothetical protein